MLIPATRTALSRNPMARTAPDARRLAQVRGRGEGQPGHTLWVFRHCAGTGLHQDQALALLM